MDQYAICHKCLVAYSDLGKEERISLPCFRESVDIKTVVKTSSSNHLILILSCQPVLWIVQKINTLFVTIDPMQYKTTTPALKHTFSKMYSNKNPTPCKERGGVRHILLLLKLCLESPIRLVSPRTSVEPNQDTVVHRTGAAHGAAAFDCNPIQCKDFIDQFLQHICVCSFS